MCLGVRIRLSRGMYVVDLKTVLKRATFSWATDVEPDMQSHVDPPLTVVKSSSLLALLESVLQSMLYYTLTVVYRRWDPVNVRGLIRKGVLLRMD